MKTLYVLMFGFLFFSCAKIEPSEIEFDGNSFELPIKVEKAKANLNLRYEYYSGFYRGNSTGKSIGTQLKDYPLFMGTDNDKEESYYNDCFVGITFFKESESFQQIKIGLEKKYDKKFRTVVESYGVTRTLPPFSFTYHFFRTREDFFVAIKEVERKPSNKRYVAASFYKGISEDDLGEYLQYVQ